MRRMENILYTKEVGLNRFSYNLDQTCLDILLFKENMLASKILRTSKLECIV